MAPLTPSPTSEPTWRKWFPDLEIPEGLTYEDLCHAAGLVHEWTDSDEFSGLYLVAEIYRLLSRAAGGRAESGSRERQGN